jgi:hypothetical protein
VQNKRLAVSIFWKLAVHPGVGVAQQTISKFLRNPLSNGAAWHPLAFEQLEYDP